MLENAENREPKIIFFLRAKTSESEVSLLKSGKSLRLRATQRIEMGEIRTTEG